MRLDNPIIPEWFSFPDMASFPEFEAEPRNHELNSPEMLAAYLTKDRSRFYDAFCVRCERYGVSTPSWAPKLIGMFDRISNNEHLRNSAPLVGNKIYDSLMENGVHVSSMDFDDIYQDVQPTIEQWLAKPDWYPPPGSYDRGEYLKPNHIQIIQERFNKAGIIEAVRYYHNAKRKVVGAFLHISTPTDSHYKQVFGASTLVPEWTNLHIDPKEDAMKAIIYLEDIGPKNGGFGYLPESNRYLHDPLTEIFGRAITTGNYMQTPEQRREVFCLPKCLRVSYNFGRAVPDDSPLANEIASRFLRVTSDMGNVMVFDAGAGAHQGGLVKEGRRISLQVLMK